MATDYAIPTPERIKEDVEHLKEWISKEPHLPKIDDEKWLTTFLYQNKFSLEKTKFKLEGYYSMRSKYPEILKNRDPTAPEILKARKWVKLALLEKFAENKKTWVFYIRYEAGSGKEFDPIMYAKRVHMVLDLMLLKVENCITDLIMIIDLENYSYLHALKGALASAQFSEIFNKAYGERVKAIHLLKFPAFAQTFLELSQKFYSKKFNERMHVHSESKSTLFEMVDEGIVCREFGGSGPSFSELEEQTQQELEKHQKWFLAQDDVCSDESLRRKDFDQVEEMRGSFRKLEVD